MVAKTHHDCANNICAAETFCDLDFILLCCTDILCADNALEIFAMGKRDTIYDCDRKNGLDR